MQNTRNRKSKKFYHLYIVMINKTNLAYGCIWKKKLRAFKNDVSSVLYVFVNEKMNA